MEMGQVRECSPREARFLLSPPSERLGKQPVCVGSLCSSAKGIAVRDSSSEQSAWHTERAPLSGPGPSLPCHVLPVHFRQREAPARVCGSNNR